MLISVLKMKHLLPCWPKIYIYWCFYKIESFISKAYIIYRYSIIVEVYHWQGLKKNSLIIFFLLFLSKFISLLLLHKLMKEFNAWLTGSVQIQVSLLIKTAVKYFNSDVQTFLFNDSSRSFLHFLATQQVAAG